MPSPPPKLLPGKVARAHIAEAEANASRFGRFVLVPDDAGWALVVLFYSSLHLVQAHAITRCRQLGAPVPSDHIERRSYVARHLGGMAGPYRRLQEASERVRYELWRPTTAEVELFHTRDFERICRYLLERGIAW